MRTFRNYLDEVFGLGPLVGGKGLFGKEPPLDAFQQLDVDIQLLQSVLPKLKHLASKQAVQGVIDNIKTAMPKAKRALKSAKIQRPDWAEGF